MTDEGRARLYCLVLKKWAGERKYGVNDRKRQLAVLDLEML